MSDRYTPAEALDLLVDSFDGEPDGWSAIVADAAAESAPKHGVRGIPTLRRGTRIRLGLLVAGVAAVAALIVTSPWKTTGPAGISDAQAAQILRKVQAAAAPRPGWVLHQRIRRTFVLIPERKSGRSLRRRFTIESWAQTTSPYRERWLTSYHSRTIESGTTLKPCLVSYYFDQTTMVLAHDIATDPTTGAHSCVHLSAADAGLKIWDSTKYFRKQLAAGWLTVVGRTSIDGEDVYRLGPSRKYILKNPKRAYGDNSEVDYVDAESYRLVRFEWLTSSCDPSYRGIREIIEYKTREYLPPTAANLALTDIKKQHPGARTSTFYQLSWPSRRLFERVQDLSIQGC